MYRLMVKFFMYALVFHEANDTIKFWRKSLKDIKIERRQYNDAWQAKLRQMVLNRSIDPSKVTQSPKLETCLEVLRRFQKTDINDYLTQIDGNIIKIEEFINTHTQSLETTFKSYKQYYECMGFTEMTEVTFRKYWQESSFKKNVLNEAIAYLKLDPAWYHLEKFEVAWKKFKTMAVSPCTRDRPWLKSKVEQGQLEITNSTDQWIINWNSLPEKFGAYSEMTRNIIRNCNNKFAENEPTRYKALQKLHCKKIERKKKYLPGHKREKLVLLGKV